MRRRRLESGCSLQQSALIERRQFDDRGRPRRVQSREHPLRHPLCPHTVK